MPDHSPSTDEGASLAQPSQSSSPLECTSHLGLGLLLSLIFAEAVKDNLVHCGEFIPGEVRYPRFSASSMQSPPASAEATSVEILSPGLARPSASPRSQAPVNQLGQTQTPGEGGRKDQPGIGDQAGVVEGDAAGVVGVEASWVLLVSGWFSVSKTIIPEAREHFLVSSGPRYTPSFGGLGLICRRQSRRCLTRSGVAQSQKRPFRVYQGYGFWPQRFNDWKVN